MVAAWLRRLGHDAHVLEGGIDAARGIQRTARPVPADHAVPVRIDPATLAARLGSERDRLIDLRPSQDYRLGHIAGAVWSTRPRLNSVLEAGAPHPVVLIATDEGTARLAAIDLSEVGVGRVELLTGNAEDWKSAGLPIAVTPDEPPDKDRIDFLFFTHRRHEGNAEAARQYLAWEIGLLGQLDAQERGVFRIGAAAQRGQTHGSDPQR
jgi:rhodanese-related sulfurtransferase